ncbi:MAG: hypothetical protein A4E61_01597 [Syntrophorhabdus sp. PtaB.Bin184]|nr:MAG: hypothetical protein A4E61_01597 [Syntrophorhabdus sp. PtaB.Bin184]
MSTAPHHSPWGPVQDAFVLADGIVQVSTASHGGIWLSPERQKELRYKENFLKSTEWWEEDCDWAVPYAFFSRDIRERGAACRLEDNLKIAVTMIRCLHPAFLPRLKGRLNLEGTEA